MSELVFVDTNVFVYARDGRDALKQQRGPMMDKLAGTSLGEIVADPQLLDFARTQGRVAFADNCAPCHGAGGGGARGYPNLNDDEWLWGGKLSDIEQTIRFGARSGDNKGRAGSMPAFGRDKILKPNEVSAVADFARSLSGLSTEPGADLALGKKVFAENCSVCHGDEGKGNREMGAPNLTDKIWRFDGSVEGIKRTIAYGVNAGDQKGRVAVMPSFKEAGKLSDAEMKKLAVYVYKFGGGQADAPAVPAAPAEGQAK